MLAFTLDCEPRRSSSILILLVYECCFAPSWPKLALGRSLALSVPDIQYPGAGTPKAVKQIWDLSQYPIRLLIFRIQDLVQTVLPTIP